MYSRSSVARLEQASLGKLQFGLSHPESGLLEVTYVVPLALGLELLPCVESRSAALWLSLLHRKQIICVCRRCFQSLSIWHPIGIHGVQNVLCQRRKVSMVLLSRATSQRGVRRSTWCRDQGQERVIESSGYRWPQNLSKTFIPRPKTVAGIRQRQILRVPSSVNTDSGSPITIERQERKERLNASSPVSARSSVTCIP